MSSTLHMAYVINDNQHLKECLEHQHNPNTYFINFRINKSKIWKNQNVRAFVFTIRTFLNRNIDENACYEVRIWSVKHLNGRITPDQILTSRRNKHFR